MTVTITPPSLSAADSGRLPFYNGWIEITQRASNNIAAKTFSVPYFGVAGNMISAPILDRSDIFASDYADVTSTLTFPLLKDNSGAVQASDNTVKSYSLRAGVTVAGRLAMGSREVLYDVVEAAAGQTGLVTTSLPTIGRIEQEPVVPRDNAVDDPDNGYTVRELKWRGLVASSGGDGSTTVGFNRPVRILVRALKIFGDSANAADYDSWLSPPFQLTR